MAVRFSAAGQHYTTNLGLGAVPNWSVTAWVKVTTDRNAFSTFWGFDGGDGGTARVLQTDDDGTTAIVYPAASSDVSLTAGTWYFIGASGTGTSGTIRVRAQGAGSFSGNTWAGQPGNQQAATLRFGESVFGGEWLNGCLAAVKVWMGTTLTTPELEAEYQYRTPLKTTGITCYYTFDTASTVDNSGNGRTLTGGTGATTEAGPTLIDVPSGSVINGWGRVPIL